MASQKFHQIFSLLVVASGLIGNLGCDSGSNNSMSGADGSKSKVADTDSSNAEVPGPQTEPPLTQTPETAHPTDASSVKVKVVDRAGLDELIAKHKGHVVLVDYWATWCAPCRKKFPHTVALAKQHQNAGLVVIGVSLDDDDAHEEVVQFLTEQQPTFENLRSKTGASDESFESFEIPNGALPCLRLFDREGQVRKVFAIDLDAEKQFTDDDVADGVKAALAK